jgi:iron complex outermembrane receptor protein
VAADSQNDARRGYENFIGPTLGVTGKLRRDETQTARNTDAYLQAELPLGDDVLASAGLRSTRLRMAATDAYLSNGDDSGARQFSATLPVAGLRWAVVPGLALHASAARGFEAPTLGELSYRPDGRGGFNTELVGQASRQVELGARWRPGTAWQLDLAWFDAQVANELGVATNSGGRQTFRNVGRTSRRGTELATVWRPAAAWTVTGAATWLDARYRDAFLVCVSAPCSVPNLPVAAGGRVAGTQRASGFAELAWRHAAVGELALETRAAAPLVADDRNSAAAAGYALLALRWQRDWALVGAQRLALLLRLDNALDRRYAGSVIVNESNGRVLEPGAPRALLLGLRWTGPGL